MDVVDVSAANAATATPSSVRLLFQNMGGPEATFGREETIFLAQAAFLNAESLYNTSTQEFVCNIWALLYIVLNATQQISFVSLLHRHDRILLNKEHVWEK